MSDYMKKYTINMKSHADMVEGHGVLSAYKEQVRLVKEGLSKQFTVTENHKGGGDITHYHTVNFGYFLTLPLAKMRGKTVGYVHFLPETIEDSLKLSPIAKKVFYQYLITFYKSMDRLVTVNPIFIDKLAAYGIPKEKISYIPNYVSEKEFYPLSQQRKKELRQEWGLCPDKFTVICTGQLQTRKGVLDFAQIANRLPEMQFLWAGGFSFGKMTDGYEEISRLLKSPPPNLVFPGMVPREKMNEIYNIGDVMFLPSYGELFPMTILEAMSCNTPILLRDIDVYPKILMDFYLKASDNQGFENCLRRMKDDPDYYKAAKEAAHRGHMFYNASHVLSMWEEFYTCLIQETRHSEKSLPAHCKAVREKGISA